MIVQIISQTRLRYVDIAKGIAIICIILGHLGSANINRVVFTFHVPIFYFITGYFINTKRNIKDFLKNKVKTVLVPYIVTCIFIILFACLLAIVKDESVVETFKYWGFASFYGAGDSYNYPFYIPAIGALWFLLATFWGSLFLRIFLDLDMYIRTILIYLLFILGIVSRNLFWFPFSIQAGACATLFMYMGYLLKCVKPLIDKMTKEVKIFGLLFCVITTFYFIRDFQSFWLVHCDIGRGVVDIFGCICACVIVIYISKFIDNKLNDNIGKFLSYFGKYSLLVLCVHIIELNLLPWWSIANKIGIPSTLQLPFIAFTKIVIDFLSVYVLSKIKIIRRIYGFKA